MSAMPLRIGIRREDKNRWERRVPLTPRHAKELIRRRELDIWVQPSKIRIFHDERYRQAGATVSDDLGPCPVVIGVKEMPLVFFEPRKTYLFFSHTVKGQPRNMPMLKRLLELGCTLLDYERMVTDIGKRIVSFGRFAGLAGMVDTLWALGQRLNWENIDSPFSGLRQAYRYGELDAAKLAVKQVGDEIAENGIPGELAPLIIGVAGYGATSQGAQEILDLLPVREIEARDLEQTLKTCQDDVHRVYKVVFRVRDLVAPLSLDHPFKVQQYYQHPHLYRSVFDAKLPCLSVLVNCVYWEPRYPRLVTKTGLKALFSRRDPPRLRVIGDITCDIEGAIECTLRATTPEEPVFVYDPLEDAITPGFQGTGPVVLAIDNLPCEFPKDASMAFSQGLKDYLAVLARADLTVPFEKVKLPPSLKRAMVVYQGSLTPNYHYLAAKL